MAEYRQLMQVKDQQPYYVYFSDSGKPTLQAIAKWIGEPEKI